MDEVMTFANVNGTKLSVSDLLDERDNISSVYVTGEKGSGKSSFANIALKSKSGNGGFIIRISEADKSFEIVKIDGSSLPLAVKYLVQDHE